MDEETIRQVARASRAIAKTTGKGIDAAREFGGWLNKVFGRSIVNTVDLVWTNRVETLKIRAAIYDYKKLVLLARAVEKELKKQHVKRPHSVPAKIALPLLENATMENEPRLRALWAKLLASGMAGERIERSYVTALSEMTGRDAKAIDAMYREWLTVDKRETRSGPVKYEGGVDSYDDASTSKLFALGIVAPIYVTLSLYEPGGHNRYGDYGASSEDAAIPGDLQVVKFTKHGEAFCQALGMGKAKGNPKRGS
jgi:hypothetical protein